MSTVSVKTGRRPSANQHSNALALVRKNKVLRKAQQEGQIWGLAQLTLSIPKQTQAMPHTKPPPYSRLDVADALSDDAVASGGLHQDCSEETNHGSAAVLDLNVACVLHLVVEEHHLLHVL